MPKAYVSRKRTKSPQANNFQINTSSMYSPPNAIKRERLDDSELIEIDINEPVISKIKRENNCDELNHIEIEEVPIMKEENDANLANNDSPLKNISGQPTTTQQNISAPNLEKLITLVHERKPLWDKNSKSTYDRFITKKLWSEVANEVNLSCEAAKLKWTYLRGFFRKEQLKITNNPSKKSNWPYYESLLFLKDHFVSKPSENNREIESCSSKAVESYCEDLNESAIDQINAEENSSSSHLNFLRAHNITDDDNSKTRKVSANKVEILNRRNDLLENLLQLKQSMFDQYKSNVTQTRDEDYHFLMSLLPILQRIPKQEKLSSRIKIMEVLKPYSEQYTDKEIASPCTGKDDGKPTKRNCEDDVTIYSQLLVE